MKSVCTNKSLLLGDDEELEFVPLVRGEVPFNHFVIDDVNFGISRLDNPLDGHA